MKAKLPEPDPPEAEPPEAEPPEAEPPEADPHPPAGGEPFTDLGHARRFVEKSGPNLRFCTGRGWMIWDDKRWCDDEKQHTLHLCSESARAVTVDAATRGLDEKILGQAKRMESRQHITGAMALASAEPRVAVRANEMDANRWLLTVANGTLDLRNATLHRHRRDDLITHLVPHEYDTDAPCPQRWLQFLNEVMAGRPELVAFLQRWCGYCLTGQTTEQALVFAVGKGCNGKTVFVETLQHVLGAELTGAAPPGLLLMQKQERHPTELQYLAGRRLIVASEVPKGATFNEERIKWLTGGDTMNGRGMHQNFRAFQPVHKLVLCANDMPRVRDASDGFWRRLRVVPFDVSFLGREDKHLTATLQTEASDILAWAVQGCLEWQQHGLGEPTAVKEATAAYRSAEDLVGRFLAEQDISGPYPAGPFYVSFQTWARDQGEYAVTQTSFGRELANRGWTKTKSGTRSWTPPEPDLPGV